MGIVGNPTLNVLNSPVYPSVQLGTCKSASFNLSSSPFISIEVLFESEALVKTEASASAS